MRQEEGSMENETAVKISFLTIDLDKERRIYFGAETPNSFNVNCPSHVFRRFHQDVLFFTTVEVHRTSISFSRTDQSCVEIAHEEDVIRERIEPVSI